MAEEAGAEDAEVAARLRVEQERARRASAQAASRRLYGAVRGVLRAAAAAAPDARRAAALARAEQRQLNVDVVLRAAAADKAGGAARREGAGTERESEELEDEYLVTRAEPPLRWRPASWTPSARAALAAQARARSALRRAPAFRRGAPPLEPGPARKAPRREDAGAPAEGKEPLAELDGDDGGAALLPAR